MSSLYQKHIPCLSISQSSVDYAAVDGVYGEIALFCAIFRCRCPVGHVALGNADKIPCGNVQVFVCTRADFRHAQAYFRYFDADRLYGFIYP